MKKRGFGGSREHHEGESKRDLNFATEFMKNALISTVKGSCNDGLREYGDAMERYGKAKAHMNETKTYFPRIQSEFNKLETDVRDGIRLCFKGKTR
jgi:hypothetical protein